MRDDSTARDHTTQAWGRREQLFEIGGRAACVCEWGPVHGRPVILVHGVLDQALAWQPVAQLLAAEGWRAIAPDLRGHGRSDHDTGAQGYSLLGYVADLAELIEQLALDGVTLVGHSMGSLVAVIYASTQPSGVNALVLVESLLPAGVDKLDMREALRKDVQHMRARHCHATMKDQDEAIRLLRYANPRLAHAFAAELCERVTLPVAGGLVWRWDPVLRTRVGLRFPGRQHQYLELLQQLEVPVELLFGRRSRFNSEDDSERLTRAFQRVNRRDMDGGHNLHLENPAAIAAAVRATRSSSGSDRH